MWRLPHTGPGLCCQTGPAEGWRVYPACTSLKQSWQEYTYSCMDCILQDVKWCWKLPDVDLHVTMCIYPDNYSNIHPIICYTVKPVLRDHCHDRPPVLKDHTFLAEGPTFKHNWTYHQRPPVLTDHIFYFFCGQWGGLSRQVLLYLLYYSFACCMQKVFCIIISWPFHLVFGCFI